MFVDEASVLAERYPHGTVILTWCCQTCARGWTAPRGHWWPDCDRCGRPAEQRGAHVAIPLREAA